MNSKAARREIERLLEKHCSDWSLEAGKKHHRVTIRRGTAQRTFAAPISPSCPRALLNWETRLKQKIQELKQEVTT